MIIFLSMHQQCLDNIFGKCGVLMVKILYRDIDDVYGKQRQRSDDSPCRCWGWCNGFFHLNCMQITPSGGAGSLGDSALLKFIGTYAGHVIEFKVHSPSFSFRLLNSTVLSWNMVSRDSSVVECPTCDWKVTGSSLGRNSRFFFLWGSTFCDDSYFAICSIPVLLNLLQ